MPQELLSINSRVAVPLIIVKIGEYSFGLYDKTRTNIELNGRYYSAVKVTYPNYMKQLVITKVNGTVNTYELQMVYPITQNDDPNLIDKILSTVSNSRKIVFTYGDCATPSFMYRNEEALITNVTSSIDVKNAKITYNITAVSSSLKAASGSFNFPRYTNKKPSDVIKELLYNKSYGLQDIFYGMSSKAQVEQLGLIADNDKAVTIEAQTNITVLKYLNYLVSCMSSANDSVNATEKYARYIMTLHDDTSNVLDGPYFKVDGIKTSISSGNSIDYYTVDIGYPNKDMVVSFSVDDNQAYTILYNYSGSVNRTDYVYRIDDYGSVKEIYSPAISTNSTLFKTTQSDRTWWSQVTQFPIKATLTIRGLLRAAILMSYLRVNVYFYGKKHNSSGTYIITKQVDRISESGYTTELSLSRIDGDN